MKGLHPHVTPWVFPYIPDASVAFEIAEGSRFNIKFTYIGCPWQKNDRSVSMVDPPFLIFLEMISAKESLRKYDLIFFAQNCFRQ
jgi:hypothetical protein